MFSRKHINVEANDEKYEMELASSILSKGIGLYFRKEGKMLFKFKRPVSHNINMAFVLDDLYLYFIDKDKKVIKKEYAKRWTKDPRTWKTYSAKNYKYLIESFDTLPLSEGDKIKIEK